MNRPASKNHGSTSTESPKAVKRALLSVSDKTGMLEFATALADQGVELLSTGGTAQLLADAGIPVVEVSEHTGFPEMMGGRVKTLHPVIHGGILGRRGTDDTTMSEHAIAPIDLVVVNLYPFASAVARPDCTLQDAIENIDIGGPAMLRSAAKNYISVAVVSDPADYVGVMAELAGSDGLTDSYRFKLALKAFSHTAAYDTMISDYLGSTGESGGSNSVQGDSTGDQSSLSGSSLPGTLNLQFHKLQELRYGENPHQFASFYRHVAATEADIAGAVSIQGKPLSYNNIADADAALECVRQFDTPACVIVKHANPCGVALAPDLLLAYEKAYQCDPTSAFGGILAFNRPINGACVAQILETQFVEVLLAPSFDDAARKALEKKPAVRALQFSTETHSVSTDAGHRPGELDTSVNRDLRYHTVSGGLLVQSADNLLISSDGLKVVTAKSPSESEIEDLLFAWKVAKFVKSNAIVYARNQQTIGIGAGQMSRVYSARIAAIKAMDESLQVAGSVMSSDAFFPFRDGIDSAAEAGIVAVIQPGGSNNDQQVIDAANEHGMAMVFTGMRHFRH